MSKPTGDGQSPCTCGCGDIPPWGRVIRGHNRKTWTATDRRSLEEAYITAGAGNVNIRALGIRFNRSPANISREARQLGLTRQGRPQPLAVREAQSQRCIARLAAGYPMPSMKGLRHSAAARAKQSAAARRNVELGIHPLQRPRSQATRAKHAESMHRRLIAHSSVFSRGKVGKRADLDGQFFRSRWEANYARLLVFLQSAGMIRRWLYEPTTFWFTNIKRGVRSYTPDFMVERPDGTNFYIEIKGWLDPKSKTKLARLARYYPHVQLTLVDAAAYKLFAKAWARTLVGWE